MLPSPHGRGAGGEVGVWVKFFVFGLGFLWGWGRCGDGVTRASVSRLCKRRGGYGIEKVRKKVLKKEKIGIKSAKNAGLKRKHGRNVKSRRWRDMDKHDDLLEAALKAVNEVESRSEDRGNRFEDKLSKVLDNPETFDDLGIDLNLSLSAFSARANEVETAPCSKDAECASENAPVGMSPSELTASEEKKAVRNEENKESKVVRPYVAKNRVPVRDSDSQGPAREGCLRELAVSRARVEELERECASRETQCEALQTQCEALQAQVKQLNDRIVRMAADFDNYRKRVTRDQEQQTHQAEERIVLGFLPTMDNLERALAHAHQVNDFAQLLNGIEMTHKLYLSALAKMGCTPFESVGHTCDPVYHDVLSRVVDSDQPHNSIVQEHLKGYMMHERVIRPALVVVSQHEGSDQESLEGEGGEEA